LEREGTLLRFLPRGYLVFFLINHQKVSCQKSAPNLDSDLFNIPFKPQEMCVFVCLCERQRALRKSSRRVGENGK